MKWVILVIIALVVVCAFVGNHNNPYDYDNWIDKHSK